MNPRLIQQLDYWLGLPLCALLTLWRRFMRCWRSEPMVPMRKILFLKMTEQGATVIAHAAIQRAIEMVGRAHVYFWVFEENRPIIEILDLIPPQNILTIRNDRPLTTLIDFARTIVRIRAAHIDTCIDLEFLSRAAAILGYLSGARRRVGFDRFTNEGGWRGHLLTHRVQYNAYLHTSVASRMLMAAAETDGSDELLLRQPPPSMDYPLPRFVPTEADRAAVLGLLQRGLGEHAGQPLVILNPNASDMLPLRKWPSERFVELARQILEHAARPSIVFTGGRGEAAAVDKMLTALHSPRVTSVAGQTSLRQLLTLYCDGAVLVTNDSGPAQFSSLTDVHAIVLFGPETPHLYGPLGSHRELVWAGLACSPCINIFNQRVSPCKNNVCMQSISVASVLERVSRALAKTITV